MSKQSVIVTLPYGKAWAVKREGAVSFIAIHETEEDAVAAGKVVAKREGVEHIILGDDGEVIKRLTYD